MSKLDFVLNIRVNNFESIVKYFSPYILKYVLRELKSLLAFNNNLIIYESRCT